jgi:magnesium chelatase family protein
VRSLPSGIGIHIEVPRVEYEKLSDDRLGEPSQAIRERVEAARDSRWSQRVRFEGTRLRTNAGTPALRAGASMDPAEVREHCRIDDAGKSLLRAAMRQLQMSARAYHRILKLARTIADPSILVRAGLAGSASIEPVHLAEVIQNRPRRQARLGRWSVSVDRSQHAK